MLQAIIQTSEISENGHIFITSKSQDFKDSDLCDIFDKIKKNNTLTNSVIFMDDLVYYIKPTVQKESGRNCETSFVLTGIDVTKLSNKQEETITTLITDLLNNRFSQISYEYKNENSFSRDIIFKSEQLTEFENIIKQQDFPASNNIKRTNNEKKHSSSCCSFFTVIFLLSIIIVYFTFFNKQSTDKFYVLSEIAQKHNCPKTVVANWNKEKEILSKLKNPDIISKYQSAQNTNNWPYILCKQNKNKHVAFFEIKSDIKPEQIIEYRKWSLNCHQKLEELINYIRANEYTLNQLQTIVNEDKLLENFYNWLKKVKNITITDSNGIEIHAPLFNDQDICFITDILSLTISEDLQITNILLNKDKENYSELRDYEKVKDISSCFISHKLKDSINKLISRIEMDSEALTENQRIFPTTKKILTLLIDFCEDFKQ